MGRHMLTTDQMMDREVFAPDGVSDDTAIRWSDRQDDNRRADRHGGHRR